MIQVRKTNKQSLDRLEKIYSDRYVRQLIKDLDRDISSNNLYGKLIEKIFAVVRIYENERGFALFRDFEKVFKNEIKGEVVLKEDPQSKFILWTGLNKEFCDAFLELNNHLIFIYKCGPDFYEEADRVKNEKWLPVKINTSKERHRDIEIWSRYSSERSSDRARLIEH